MDTQQLRQFLPVFGLLALGLGFLGVSIVEASNAQASHEKNFSIVNHFYLGAVTYHFEPANMPSGYSWGGRLNVLNHGQEAITHLQKLDSDQFLKLVSDFDVNQYCILCADTEFGNNSVKVYEQHNLSCSVVSHLVNKIPGYAVYDDTVRISE